MGEPVRISDRDVRALLDIVAGDRHDDAAGGLPPSLLADLSDQIASDAMSFYGLDSQRQTGWFGQDLPEGSAPVSMSESEFALNFTSEFATGFSLKFACASE